MISYDVAADLGLDFVSWSWSILYNVTGEAHQFSLLPHIYKTFDYICGTKGICDFQSGCKHTFKVLFTCIVYGEKFNNFEHEVMIT